MSASDIIFLHGIEVDCVIGVWNWERQITQKLIIDLDMAADIRKAAETDALEDTLNYKAVAKRIRSFAETSDFRLIETLAERIADILREEFAVPWCRVSINKGGAVRGCRSVGLVIERSTG